MISVEKHIAKELFVQHVKGDLDVAVSHNKRSIEKIAASYGITDKTEVKELTELAIVLKARSISLSDLSIEEKYWRIVDLYKSQVNLSHRTSHSILLQQYSTPAPIAFMAGIFVNADSNISVFEPSAGNGLLTIAADPSRVVVNEIDPLRRSNLESQGYRSILRMDATLPFFGFEKSFDAVLTNPPFGLLSKEVSYETFRIKLLDHLMALRGLDCMRNDGKAAIIIGGHNRYDRKGRFQKGKHRFFFNYLFSRYNVVDLINIDGHALYSRQGTSFDVRLILIDDRKPFPSGAAPLKDAVRDKVVDSFEELFDRVMKSVTPRNEISMKTKYNNIPTLELEAQALALELELLSFNELGMPYTPASESCVILDTVVPDSMGNETHNALQKIKEAVGGDMDEYVRQRLNYSSKTDLCRALSAEQIDAVALCIYNIEERRQGMIIGDQTGIGKGRIAASMIRYGVEQGLKPIFLTEKANLFSDIYRDLVAIGSDNLVPFIINSRESKTDIKDEDGKVVYQALSPSEQDSIFKEQKVPGRFDFVVATYSQFNSAEKKPLKPNFLQAIAEDNLLIMDEAHNSSGAGNTGSFMRYVVRLTRGVVFLSATFAKRPDNMPVYALKTAINEASMTHERLIEAIKIGGVALQEIMSSQLVAIGQMIRRERSFEGVEVNYITLDEKEQEHKAIADNITVILRDIIQFQLTYVNKMVADLDDIAVEQGKQVEMREGTSQAGVDNLPYFSKVFNVIHQMLFSLKAEAIAERAIERLQEGKKPVIAFASTMGSFIEQMPAYRTGRENENGEAVSDGDTINADFSNVLLRGLEGILRYTVTDMDGNKSYASFDIKTLSTEAQADYQRILEQIRTVSTGITISPIDVIIRKISEAGYTVAEVTGRKFELEINPKNNLAIVHSRKRINTNDAFRQFNNNEVDVLLINQSGSTGASAHAIPTAKVPANEVKQRVMIVLQAELDISTEVQKRGRINRTGQIFKPIYDYVNSAIPAEKRLMMMLQKKLKSLDANTTSNQKSSTKILDVPDFLDKYGDQIVTDYLRENTAVNILLDDPLDLMTPSHQNVEKSSGESESPDKSSTIEGAAFKVSGRVAVLSTAMQQDFYTEISARYNEYVEYLKQVGEYDLEVEAMNLQAETISSRTIIAGNGGRSEFGDDSILEVVMANVLKKPFSSAELNNLLTESLQGKDGKTLQQEIMDEYKRFFSESMERDLAQNSSHYEELIKGVPMEWKMQRILKNEGHDAYESAIVKRTEELEHALHESQEKIRKSFMGKNQYIEGLLNFFYVGRNLNFPFLDFESGESSSPAVFLGFVIDKKKKNPYAPSSLRLRFAIANSTKYLVIPGNYSDKILAIKGASASLMELEKDYLLSRWETAIKENTTDRKARNIITGNLLQAFGTYHGKLVSYTTKDGGTKKGILLPENWRPEGQAQQKTEVPVLRALRVIRSLTVGQQITTSNNISLIRQSDKFKTIVSSSRSRSGDVYLDEDILALVDNHNFEKLADKMIATMDIEKIDVFINLLQEKFNASVSLSPVQYNIIKGDTSRKLISGGPFPSITHPLKPKPANDPTSELELEAMALEIELELLNFAA